MILRSNSKIVDLGDAIFQKYAGYYDLLYAEKNYAAEVDYLCSLLGKNFLSKDSLNLLDLGCGTGRHAHYFFQRGFQVKGIDLSPEMVQIAQKRYGLRSKDPENQKEANGKKKSKKNERDKQSEMPQFLLADARSFRREDWRQSFDLVSSLFHVASYQNSSKELSALFETAAYHLKRGGSFLFDFWHGPGVKKDPPAARIKRLENDQIQLVRLAEPICKEEEALVTVNYDIFIKKKEQELWDHFQESHRMRYWFCEEIEEELKAQGFTEIAFYAWMQKEEPSENDWYTLASCQKK